MNLQVGLEPVPRNAPQEGAPADKDNKAPQDHVSGRLSTIIGFSHLVGEESANGPIGAEPAAAVAVDASDATSDLCFHGVHATQESANGPGCCRCHRRPTEAEQTHWHKGPLPIMSREIVSSSTSLLQG